MLPRGRIIERVRPDDGGEQPGADDVVSLRTQVEREDLVEELLITRPAAEQLRSQRRRRPGIEHVRVRGEPAGHIALVLGEAGRSLGDGVAGQ